MGIFDFLRAPDINQGVEEWKKNKGAVLLDVRTADEYRQGHVPGSINIPLDSISKAADRIIDKDTLLYVYCLSGARSSSAVQKLRMMGYQNCKNIGGISRYTGKTER